MVSLLLGMHVPYSILSLGSILYMSMSNPKICTFCLYRSDFFNQTFEQLLVHGGAVNTLKQSVLVHENEYHQKNLDFPYVLIPER